MGMMRRVVSAITGVAAVKLDSRGGAVGRRSSLVMVLVIAILQLMGLRMVQVMAAAEEVGAVRRNVVVLAVLLAGWELGIDHVVWHWLLVLLVITTTGRIHEERAHRSTRLRTISGNRTLQLLHSLRSMFLACKGKLAFFTCFLTRLGLNIRLCSHAALLRRCCY